MVYGISIAKVGNLCKQGRLLRCRRGAQCAPGVFALKGGGEVPVLHGQECGLRGRLAGKRGPCPLLSITPAGGGSRMPATANKFYPHSVEKFDLR